MRRTITDDEIFEAELNIANEYFSLAYDGVEVYGAAGLGFPTEVSDGEDKISGFWLRKGNAASVFLPKNSQTLVRINSVNEPLSVEILDGNMKSLGQVEFSPDRPWHILSTKDSARCPAL